MQKHRLLFITGTRADYGKLKPLLKAIEQAENFELYIYVTGMHLLEQYGATFHEILKDGYINVHVAFELHHTASASHNLGEFICDFTKYVKQTEPELIIVHGDRMEALGAATVGALNNIRVAHIEGGEVSGTIDESLRHAISKLANVHFVANKIAKTRLLQLGEQEENIFVIGSPDIDIMLSGQLPSWEEAAARYQLEISKYGILLYHPVTTEYVQTTRHTKIVVEAILASGLNYIVIYPNNDLGSAEIIEAYDNLRGNPQIKIFPSIRFEYFLTLLAQAVFIIGNSSAGIREAAVFGVPAINIGSRQNGRATESCRHILQVPEDQEKILAAIYSAENYRHESRGFGNGDSKEQFMEIMQKREFWDRPLQKQFVDLVK